MLTIGNATRATWLLVGVLAVVPLGGCQSIRALQEEIVRATSSFLEDLRSNRKPEPPSDLVSGSPSVESHEGLSPEAASNSGEGVRDTAMVSPASVRQSDSSAVGQATRGSNPVANVAPSSRDDCSSQIASPDGCRAFGNSPSPVAEGKFRLRLPSGKLTVASDNSATLVVRTEIPKSAAGELVLRATGMLRNENVLNGSMSLTTPYRREYRLKVTAAASKARASQRIPIVVELIGADGQRVALAERSTVLVDSDSAASSDEVLKVNREQIKVALEQRAREACDNPTTFDHYLLTLSPEQKALVPETITRLGDAIKAYSTLSTKADNDGDTYIDYASYLQKFANSPCEEMAKRGTTVAFWVSRNSHSPAVLRQLDAAIVASRDMSEIEMGEKHFQSLAKKGNPYARLREAKIAYAAGRLADAASVLRELETKAPSPEVFEYLGYVHGSDCRESSAYFSRAIALDGHCFACYFHRGECRYTNGQHSDAKQDFLRAFELTKDRKDARSKRYHERSARRLGIN